MELTNLQRIGISYLLLQAREMNPWIRQGTIRFEHLPQSTVINMYVKEYHTKHEFVFSLKENENVSDNIIYEYLYDTTNNFFRITTVEERDGVA